MDGRDNVEIRNGTIRDFSSGIYEDDSVNGKNHRVLGVRIFSCYADGIYFAGCENCQIKDCTIADGGTITGASGSVYAIYVGGGGNVTGNSIYNFGTSTSCSAYGISANYGSVITGNSIYSVGTSSTGSYVRGIYASTGCTVTGNTCTVYGIYLLGSSSVFNNTAYDNNGTNMNLPASCVFGYNCAP